MATRIGINGFGRIGRQLLRFDLAAAGLEVAAINDITDPATLAHLLKYDSVHGRFAGEVTATSGSIVVNGREIAIHAEKEPDKIPWRKHGVELVIESTGKFTDRAGASKHLAQGVKKVVISAPAKEPDVTIAFGVNTGAYDKARHQIVSAASCTTNCLAPVAKVLDELVGIKSGLMTTIHAYTNDQRILDLPHKDLRRARAAAMSMIPTSTGAAKALSLVLPNLAGKLDGLAVRVPCFNVSVVDLTCRVSRTVTRDEVNQAFRKAAAGPLAGVLAATDEPVVSIDFNGDRHSATVDCGETFAVGDLVKVLAWYDNETGYTNRLLDLSAHIARLGW